MQTPITPVRTNRASLASLIAGIISAVLWIAVFFVYFNETSLFPGGEDVHFEDFIVIYGCIPWINIFISIAAILLGIMSLRKIKNNHQPGSKFSITGIVLGVAGLLPVLVLFGLFGQIITSR